MDRRLLRRPRSETAPPARRMGRCLRRTAQGPGPVGPAAPSAGQAVGLRVSREEWDTMQKDIWKAMATAVDESLARLDAVPVGDDESLAACARDAAGVFAALSARYEGHHPNSFALAGAARSIGRLAQRKPPPTRRTRPPSQARAAFAQAAPGASPLTSDRSEHVWQVAARLVGALAETLRLHGQIVTARRVRRRREGPGRPPTSACGPAARRGHVPIPARHAPAVPRRRGRRRIRRAANGAVRGGTGPIAPSGVLWSHARRFGAADGGHV